jgi:hypothetical protein
MRSQLLAFLVEAHSTFDLQAGTLFLAVNLLDRYSTQRATRVDEYQLAGFTALLIAAKYLDVKSQVPTVFELERVCFSCYSTQRFVEMEWDMLSALNWRIGHPDVPTLLRLIGDDVSHCPELEHLSLYIAEVAALDRVFACTKPSVLAESALKLAYIMLGGLSGPRDQQVLVALWRGMYHPPRVLFLKYSSSHLSSVALIAKRVQLKACSEQQTRPVCRHQRKLHARHRWESVPQACGGGGVCTAAAQDRNSVDISFKGE